MRLGNWNNHRDNKLLAEQIEKDLLSTLQTRGLGVKQLCVDLSEGRITIRFDDRKLKNMKTV